MLHQKRMYQLSQLLVLRDHHPMILTRQLHKLSPRNLRMGEFSVRNRNIDIGRTLQNEGRTTDAL